MEPKSMDKADFVTSLLLTIFGLAIVIISFRMPTYQELGANPYSAPGIVPAVLGFILHILGIVLLIRSISRKGYRLTISINKVILLFKQESIKRLIITLCLSIAYVWLLGKMNYFLLNSLFILLFILIFELNFNKRIFEQKRTLFIAIAEAFIIAGSIALVFQYVFLVRLP
jgi:hypothetical protein